MNNLFVIFGLDIDDNAFSTILNSEIAVVLGILGISITIFTVVYSFIENKLEDKKRLERLIHTGSASNPYNHAELKFASNYIKRNKHLNFYFVIMIYASFLLAILLAVNLVFRNPIFFCVLQALVVLYLLSFIICIISYVVSYNKRV